MNDRPATAHLPVGTRVDHCGVWIVRRDPADLVPGSGSYWRGEDGSSWTDIEIDWLVDAGARIARDYGREG